MTYRLFIVWHMQTHTFSPDLLSCLYTMLQQTKQMLVCFKIDPHSPLLVPFPKENSVAHQVVWCLYLCSGSCVLDTRMESKGQLYGVAAAALCISLAWRNLRVLWLGHSHQMFLSVQPRGSLLYLPCSHCLIEHKSDLERTAMG